MIGNKRKSIFAIAASVLMLCSIMLAAGGTNNAQQVLLTYIRLLERTNTQLERVSNAQQAAVVLSGMAKEMQKIEKQLKSFGESGKLATVFQGYMMKPEFQQLMTRYMKAGQKFAPLLQRVMMKYAASPAFQAAMGEYNKLNSQLVHFPLG